MTERCDRDPLLTPDELALELKMPRRTVVRKAASGELPSYRVGRDYRFRLSEVLEARRYHAPPDAMDCEIDDAVTRLVTQLPRPRRRAV